MWYHISVQGNGKYNIFQNTSEVLHAIDLLAVCSHQYDVDVLAYQFLSNHYHLILKCKSPAAFMQAYRISFTRYSNYKNCSVGAIGRTRYSRGVITHRNKLEDRLIYVLRNSVKHKVVEHSYIDPHNSTKYYFQEERGVTGSSNLTQAGEKRYLNNSKYYIPSSYLLDENGHIYPRSFLKYREVEKIFKNYPNFIHKISYPTAQEIEDNNGIVPIPFTMKYNDLQISEKVLNYIHPRPLNSLSLDEVLHICTKLRSKNMASIKQMSRIFSIPETSLRRKMARPDQI